MLGPHAAEYDVPVKGALCNAYEGSQQVCMQEQELSPEKRIVANVGKMDAKKHLEAEVQKMMSGNIVQCMGTMLDTIVF